MVSVLAFIFVFGILIFVHEFGHFIVAKRNGVRVEKFSLGFGRRLWGKKIGQTEYLISAVPFGGYIKMSGEEPGKEQKGKPWEFLSKSCGQRAQIVAAGAVLNYLLAFLLFSFIFIIGAPTATTRVGQLLEDYPALEAGVKEGDLILAVDGEPVEYWQDMAALIHQKTLNTEVILDVERGNRLIKISLAPKIEKTKDIFGQEVEIALVGIYPSQETTEIKYGWGKSFYKGAEKLITLSALTYKSLWFILTRRLSLKDAAMGPIGIFHFTADAARLGFIYLLNLMGLLSMSLAIFNFLPIPILDGGYLFFLALEKLRKKPVNLKTQEIAAQVGILLLITLLIFVSYYDLLRYGWLEKAQDLWSKFKLK